MLARYRQQLLQRNSLFDVHAVACLTRLLKPRLQDQARDLIVSKVLLPVSYGRRCVQREQTLLHGCLDLCTRKQPYADGHEPL